MKTKTVSFNGNNYHYVDVGSEEYSEGISFRLWIHPSFVNDFKFPVIGGKIVKQESGLYFLIPTDGYVVYHIFVWCGKRGDSTITIVGDEFEEFSYKKYASQIGTRGISTGKLVNIPGNRNILFDWERNDRYSCIANGRTEINPKGEIKVVYERTYV